MARDQCGAELTSQARGFGGFERTPPPPPLKGSRSTYVVRVPACEASGGFAPDPNGGAHIAPPPHFSFIGPEVDCPPPLFVSGTHLGHRPLVRSTFVFRTPPFPDLATGLQEKQKKHPLTIKLVGYRNWRQRLCKKEGNKVSGKENLCTRSRQNLAASG